MILPENLSDRLTSEIMLTVEPNARYQPEALAPQPKETALRCCRGAHTVVAF